LILASTGSVFGLIPVTAYFGAFISLEAAALRLILEFPFPSSNYDLKKRQESSIFRFCKRPLPLYGYGLPIQDFKVLSKVEQTQN
jgi:hypothetical protein